MSILSAITRLASAATVLALGGCYYPYGYYPYGNGYYATVPAAGTQTAVPVTASGEPAPALNQPGSIPAPPPPSVTASANYTVPSNPGTYVAPSAGSTYVVPAPGYPAYPGYAAYPAYPYPAYPAYYGYPGYWGGPAVSIGFAGYWGGGCCWGGGWHGGGWHGGGW
ncbi:hypothetical protein, partial [Paraburkholderia sp.]|uniref:hypothetical protein n=1 Tax=Paraburkholderia sp. TaxID=1926495 RepID=UPI002F4286AB